MKKLTGAVILLVLLLTAASVAVHVFVDQQALRRNLIAAVQHQTGMTLRLARSNVQLLPWPSFDAGDVVLQKGNDAPVLTARSVHAGVSLFALLHREVRLQDFTVDGAHVFVRRGTSGTPNWSFSAPVDVPVQVHPKAGTRVQTRWDVSVDAVHLTNGTIVWDDAQNGVAGHFDVAVLDLAGLRSASPWINLAASHDRTPFTVQGHVGPLALIRTGIAPWTFSLGTTMGGATHRDWLNIDGSIRDVRTLRGIAVTAQGELQATQDVQGLFPHAGLPDIRNIGGILSVQDDADEAPRVSVAQIEAALLRGLRPVRVHLHAGSVTIPGRAVRLGNIHLDADAPDASLDVASDLSVRDLAWRVQGSFGTLAQAVTAWHDRLKAFVPVDLEVRNQPLTFASALDLSGSAPAANAQDDAHLHLTGDLGAAGSHLKLTGQAQALHLPGVVLNDFATEIGAEMPDLYTLRVPDISVQSREISVTGDLAAKRSNVAAPVIVGHLHATGVDLNALQGLWQPHVSAPASAPPVSGDGAAVQARPAAPIIHGPAGAAARLIAGHTDGAAPAKPEPPEEEKGKQRLYRDLRAVDLDLHLQMDKVHFQAREYTGIETHVMLSGGHLRLEPIAGQDGPTHLSGSIDLDATMQPMRAALVFQPMVLPSGVVEKLLGIPVLIDGPMQLDGAVSGVGNTLSALQTSLKGHLGLSVVGGTVNGSALAGLAGPEAASILGAGARPLRCLGVHMTMADGNADIDTFGLQSGRFSTAGTGSLGLVSHDVMLHLVPSIDFAGAGASAPIFVTGVLPNLHATQERDANGSFQLNIGGGVASDPCPAVLRAAREGTEGLPAAAAQTGSHSKASDILRALGVLH